MSRDEQVEEMARIIANANGNEQNVAYYRPDATDLYNAGYRKASEVALEVIEDLEDKGLLNMEPWAIAELKKKYTEGE